MNKYVRDIYGSDLYSFDFSCKLVSSVGDDNKLLIFFSLRG